jgi:hypothetical protein
MPYSVDLGEWRPVTSAPKQAPILYDDLAKWLLEQVGEDERIAREASPGPWLSGTTADHLLDTTVYGPSSSSWPDRIENVCNTEYSGEQAIANGVHIACWHPTRVLAECAAKRRIIERYQFVTGHGPAVDHVRAMDMTTGATGALQDVLRWLALPYADRPGYREEWRP